MHGVCRSAPKPLAIVTSLSAWCLLGQNRRSWRYCPVEMRDFIRSEPKFLAILPSLRARRLSVGTEIPGKFLAIVITNLNSRCLSVRIRIPGKLPICMRGVCRSGPKFLAVFSSWSARRYSIRTEVPGGIYQATWEAFFGRGQSPWRYLPV